MIETNDQKKNIFGKDTFHKQIQDNLPILPPLLMSYIKTKQSFFSQKKFLI